MNSRQIAVVALQKCENSGYSNLVLKNILETTTLSNKDKGLVSILVYGTIEKMMLLDFILQPFIKKPIEKLDSEVRAILRSGLYQCLFLTNIPNRAAINEAVLLTKKMGKTSASGFVNAVLRKTSVIDVTTLKFKNELERISVTYCVSKSIAKIFMNSYKENYEDILKACLEKAELTIRVNTLKTTQDKLITLLTDKKIEILETDINNCLIVKYKGDITKTQEFKDGLFNIQGKPSQITALLVNAKKGEKIIDVCSAPGGKSSIIAQTMQNSGELYSCDLQESRLSLIQKVFNRLNITVGTVMQNDACVYNKKFENADAVLCDVPCSGIGILSKKPDIRYKDLTNLQDLINIQKKILETSSKYVKKGGRLIYSTCSLNPNENQNVVSEFLKTNKEFKLKDTVINDVKYDGETIFLPQKGQSDGFYLAYLERMC